MKQALLILLALVVSLPHAWSKPKKLAGDIKYEVTSDGTLIISGFGDMPTWTTPQNEAWYKDGKWHKINRVIIEEGITSIGFKNFSPIGNKYARTTPLEVQLPASLQVIGDFAFKGTPVSKINFPEGLKGIGLGAFTNSVKMDSVVFPSTLRTISEGAFMHCDIKKIHFHSDVAVNPGAFFECRTLSSIDFNNAWTELCAGSFEGNHRLAELLSSENFRIVNGNPFVRTPLERSMLVAAHMTMPTPPKQESAAPDDDLAQADTNEEPEIMSELDLNIPEMDGVDREHTFALVIGNENYRREARVPFASKDARIFSEYLQKTLGVPFKNVHLITDASLNDMKYGLNLLAKLSNAYEGNVNFIIYYAGHGVPDESTRDAFLLPTDGYGADPSTGYAMSALYDRLSKIPSNNTVLFLDACFSGSKREGEMMASARGVAIAPRETKASGNLVVFSAASGDETAFAYNEQGHGMFTYFLLKKLQQNLGDVSLGELSDFIITNVKQSSIRENQKSQTPTVSASDDLGETWRDIKL